MKPAIVRLSIGPHAALERRYSVKQHDHVKVGEVEGDYGPETADGAEYRVQGSLDDRGRHLYSTDYKPGASYDRGTYLFAYDAEDESLDHEGLLAIGTKLGYGPECWRRCVMPRGFSGGRETWENALLLTPVERGSMLWTGGTESVSARLKKVFPGSETIATPEGRGYVESGYVEAQLEG